MKTFLTTVLCLVTLVTVAKPRKHMALKDDLVAYWNFEQDPAVFRVHDQSGHGNHLIYNPSAPASASQNVPILGPGIQGNGILIQSPYDTLISDNLNSHNGQPFTVAFWYKPTTLVSVPGGAVIFTTSECTVRIRISTFFYFQIEFEPDGEFLSVNVPLEVGQWYFITFGYYTDNGSYLWASVNLSDRLRVAKSVLTPFPASNWIVGSSDTGGDVRGVYDEMGQWSRNVTARELRQLYNKGDGLTFEDFAEQPACPTIECCN